MAYVTSIERFALKKGIEQGLEQGREQGREQGKWEALKKLVPLLLKKGFSENEIVAETGLTLVQLHALNETEEVF
jgi:predicted transposase/invertase (TIGR01784 family)